jgi:hypothetical protein
VPHRTHRHERVLASEELERVRREDHLLLHPFILLEVNVINPSFSHRQVLVEKVSRNVS